MSRKRKLLLAAATALLISVGVVSAVSAFTPKPIATVAPSSDSFGEYRATIEAMKPPKRQRPVVAVLGDNRGTETIDFLVPYGVLREADVAEVYAVSMTPGLLQLRPALAIEAHLTAAELDARFPDGVDYLIVPAMFDHDTPEVLDWVKKQAERGTTIVAICSGAEILAKAGVLHGRRATTHWASVATMLDADPTIRWEPHRRYVADHGVVTTTGVSAAMPVALALVEAIAGEERAGEVAARLDVEDWGRAHDSGAYELGGGFWTGLGNMIAAPGKERLGIAVADGIDEIALALTADAWSRTYRSSVVTVGPSRIVTTDNGLKLVVDQKGRIDLDHMLPRVTSANRSRILDQVLADMADRYGRRTARLVAVQLEYDGRF